MQVMRILIVVFSWGILVPTPFSSIDFFRTLSIFTMSMTYDWWREVESAKRENRGIHKWFYIFSVGYSVVFLTISLFGLFNLASVSGDNMSVITFFPETELKFAISRIYVVLFMVGYPLISIVEKMVPAKIRTKAEEAMA